jgi:hypothetical protein
MITRQRIVSYGIPTLATATIIAAGLLTTGGNKLVTTDHVPSYSTGDHQIDVVFAVDTTGSMGGLLDGAKATVWSIAKHIRKTDPNADLRIGLVAYRDKDPASPDEYVTKDFSLTGDLDAVYTELAAYKAAGGGDTPEDVDAAVDDALHKMQWRPGAKKLIFVVGDAAPASRGDVPTYEEGAREAADRGITLNAIRCGWDKDTMLSFQRMASLGKGDFSTIQQDGGVQQVATPFDERIGELSREVDTTAMIVGDDGVRARWQGKMAVAAKASAPAKADRAGYYAKGSGGGLKRSDEDLVGGVATGTMALDDVKAQDLPADVRGMDKGELQAEVNKRVEKRKELQQQINTLSKQRDEYLAKHGKESESSFDAQVKKTVEKQIAK